MAYRVRIKQKRHRGFRVPTAYALLPTILLEKSVRIAKSIVSENYFYSETYK
jgi:hypothetical protein